MQAVTYFSDKAWLCTLGFQISASLINFVNTACIYISLCNYEIHSMQCTLISVLICLWVCGWVILALDQPAVLWVELCDSLVPQHQYACSRIVAHLTGCDMDCMGCLFSIDCLSDFLHKHFHLYHTLEAWSDLVVTFSCYSSINYSSLWKQKSQCLKQVLNKKSNLSLPTNLCCDWL